HAGLGGGELVHGKRTQVAGHHSVLGNDVGLAEGIAGGMRVVVTYLGTDERDAWVEGEEAFSGKFAAEAVENAGYLERGTVADVLTEYQGGMCRSSGYGEPPAGISPPRNDSRFRVAVAVLEAQRHVGVIGCFEQH